MCIERVFGRDVDVLCAYSTPKIVRAVDRRLGLLNLFFSLVILVYVAVWQIARNTGAFPGGLARRAARSRGAQGT